MQSRKIGRKQLTTFALALLFCVSAAEAQRPEARQARPTPVDEAAHAEGRRTPPGTDPARKVVAFRLRHNNADSVVALLEKVLVSLVRSEDLVLAAENAGNSILVLGTDDALGKVEDIIRELDVPEQEQKPDPAAEIKVFTLQHVSAREAAEMLRSLYADLAPFGRQRGGGVSRLAIATDERANSVIVTGDKMMLETIEALLLRLDQPRPREEAPHTEVVGLQSMPTDEVVETLRRLGMSRIEVVADNKANQIILRGDRKSVEQATQLLSKLYEGRRPQADEVRLRVIWLVSPGLAGEDAADPPKNLEKALRALESKAGIGELKMAAQFLLNASGHSGDRSEEFGAAGTASVRSARTEVLIDGRFEESSGPHPRLRVSIEARQADKGASGVRDIVVQQLCHLQATISAPPGHPVVLGMTPIDSMESVFVIELLSADEPDGAAEAVERKPAGGTGAAR